jgi:glucose-1-phosphate thymidylyltransferase
VQVIIPLAGKGTRLLPLTKQVPKPLVHVAGRPVMDYVMDTVRGTGIDVEELIVITGHLREAVERHVGEHYRFKARFVEQKALNGTAGAVDLARPFVRGPVLILFVDTLFEADLAPLRASDADAIIWAKEVEDYRHFGVVVTDATGHMVRIVEKPDAPISKLANIGFYYVRDWRTLFEGITDVMQRPPGKGGEFYLTDAFQYMVDQGRKVRVAEVRHWFDCGKVETLLETNHHLLEGGRARMPAGAHAGCTFIPPVRIEDGVVIQGSTVGPNVTIETGSEIRESTIANSILGRHVRVTGGTVKDSVVGDGQVVEGRAVVGSVLAGGELAPAR